MTFVIYNDYHLLSFYLGYSIYLLLLLFTSILWHELGHALYFKFGVKKNIKVYIYKIQWYYYKIYAGIESDYNMLSDQQYKRINFCGIVLGLVPIILASMFNTSPFPISLMLVPYFVGLRHDLKVILKDITIN